MSKHPSIHVAIIGGGLCGLALAIALERRHVSYTIYELQSSFSEIGAGLNVAPNALAAFNLIDPSLGDAVMALATRNSPDPDVWMEYRLGAPTDEFPDAHLVTQISAPGTGNTTVGRYELLSLLASRIDHGRARFRKKLVKIEQVAEEGEGGDGHATLLFEDGTTDSASVVIGCDGIHSSVRKCMLGPGHPAAEPRFAGIAGYRAVFQMEKLEEAIGSSLAHTSCIWGGPGGYVTMYTIEGGRKVTCGLWLSKEHLRSQFVANERWVLKNQKGAMLEDFKNWGPTVQKLMSMMNEDMQLWTSHHHDIELESYFDGCVCLIGDAAHSMGPHQGQGANQAMEDAYVMAEVLSQIDRFDGEEATGVSTRIKAAFTGYQDVRKPQFEWVTRTSHDAFAWWAGFWRAGLTQADIEERKRDAAVRFSRIWEAGVGRQAEIAKGVMRRTLGQPADSK
ncbi:hypothetical protein BJ170DRAFT_621258 [Xylariales sp. AK1849]|nr:hypothetical protein BJ170DRAFT_621258 [Xylariales sp. AK1849]